MTKYDNIIIKCDENKNKIMGNEPKMINSNIIFRGNNNILFCEENVKLKNTTLQFNGNNSIIYLSSNKHEYYLNVAIYNYSVLFMDENNYMNGKLNIIFSEQKNVIIGKECLFSFGIWMRLADAHLIYDVDTKKRTNLSKSICIGDHVWISQNSMILKGTKIGSGSIVGAMAVVTNKSISSNTIWAGNPAKEIKRNIYFKDNCVHKYTDKETELSIIDNSDDYIYNTSSDTQNFNEIDIKLHNMGSVEEKINYLRELRNFKSKNRFFIK